MSEDPKLGKYQQTPKEFRKQIKDFCRERWNWLFDKPGEELDKLEQVSPKGGELAKFITTSIQQTNSALTNSALNQRILKISGSKVVRGIAVVLVVSSFGVLIKRDTETVEESQTSIPEILFSNLESISLASAGIIFLLETQERRKRDHYEAWQVINAATGKIGSGGRIQALEDLARDDVNLSGLEAEKADLSGIILVSANLTRANFRGTQLDHANLKGANLEKSKLMQANLTGANLEGANLRTVNLRRANLRETILTNADLTEAGLSGSVQVTYEQLEKAKICRTKLPAHISLDSNRDCRRLNIDPKTGRYLSNEFD